MNPLRYVAKKAFDERLNTDGPTHTFARLCTSRHVDDLQGIATLALTAMVGLVATVIYQFVYNPTAAKDQIAIYTAVLAATAGVVSWTYQSGSRRLGAVDLFASEISAICRVCLIVDFAGSSVAQAETSVAETQVATSPVPDRDAFTSEEKYTPVADTSLSELQSLDFDVVKSVTNFYTYRKTMMDFMRKIAVTPCATARHELQIQMIYMQFLMYESAREAVARLVEFEPDKSESLINILCSELTVFGFLMSEHASGFLGDRLRLRLPVYEKLVERISRKAARHHHGAWKRARTSQPALAARYADMLAIVAGTAAATPRHDERTANAPRKLNGSPVNGADEAPRLGADPAAGR